MTDLENYALTARKLGVELEQIKNFLKAGIVLQPRQLAASAAARMCDHPNGPTEIAYGGARGGGKSFWLLAQMGADDCQRLDGLKCLLLRKVGKANIEHFQDLRMRLFSFLPHEFSLHRGMLTFANGSKIISGHYQNEKDIDAYLGLEYDVIGIEEATTLTFRKFQDILTCCRSSKRFKNNALWRPRIYLTTNPGGVGHAWFKERYINRKKTSPQPSTIFIPATVRDNKFCNPDYEKSLASLTGWQKKAWYYGDWNIAAGQYFVNFSRDIHVVTSFDERLATKWWCAMDYGFTHYTVVLLAAADSEGNIYVIDEFAKRLSLPERNAADIKSMLHRHGLNLFNLRRFVVGGDAFARREDGKCVADHYAALGIRLQKARSHRVEGWTEILKRLGDPSSGIKPTLFIHERCAKLIEQLPAMVHDPSFPEDVLKVDLDEDGNGGDDAVDCLRYLIASHTPGSIWKKLIGG